MPIMCPLRQPIRGVPMKNRTSAKRAAALEVCKRLHKCGELTNHLLPRNEIVNIEEDHDYLFKHWVAKDIETSQQGTKKCPLSHNIVVSF